MHEASPENEGIAQGIELDRLCYEVVDRVPCGRGAELADSRRARALKLGTYIDQYEGFELRGVGPRVLDRVQPAHRHANKNEPLPTTVLNKCCDIFRLGRRAVVHDRGPLAVAVTALVKRHTVVVLPQGETHEVEGMRIQSAAVQKENRRHTRRPPIEAVESHEKIG